MQQIQLRNYQSNALNDVIESFKTNKNCVLSMAPSGGKTVTAIEKIKIFLKENSTSRALIIAHGQNILKSMWQKALKKYLTEEEISRVICDIPHNHRKMDLKGVELIVIDEAHEFTFAKTVEEILQKLPKAKKLYLTGTPSRFIAKGPEEYPLVMVAGAELVENGFMSDLSVGLFATKARLTEEDRNRYGDLSPEAIERLEKTTKQDVEACLDAMLKRLKDFGFLKIPAVPLIRNRSPWSFGWLEKTLWACASIKQAEMVFKHLQSKNISARISHSENDPDSLQILGDGNGDLGFLHKDDKTLVLVVVDRATLGFDMPWLVNVVDMTGSHNPDRCYQLLSRALRKNPEKPDQRKYFYKINNEKERDITKIYMTATLCLLWPDFLSKYNGKNLNGMRIPVIDVQKRSKNKGEPTKVRKKNTVKKSIIEENLFETLNTVEMLKDMLHKCGEPLGEYASCSIKSAIGNASGVDFYVDWTNEEEVLEIIVKLARDNGLMSQESKEGSVEDKMIEVLRLFKNRKHLYSFPRGRGICDSMRRHYGHVLDKALPVVNTVEENKQKIIDFINRNGRRPSFSGSATLEERRLAHLMKSYTTLGLNRYDADFAAIVEAMCPKIDTVSQNKEAIMQLAIDGKPKPKKGDRLVDKLHRYTSPNSPLYDEEWTEQLKHIRPDWFKTKQDLSFERMMKIMPQELVSFEEGQEWKGAGHKHWFVCKKYGRFYRTANANIARSWKVGLSGHPKMGRENIGPLGSKRVYCNQNQKTYQSMRQAGIDLNVGHSSIQAFFAGKVKQVKGYTFKYID